MADLTRDLRYAWRLIRKAPTLSIATIVTLALGIGLNAGVFTVLSGLMLRPRVTVDPQTFVHLQPSYSGDRAPEHEASPAFSTRDYVALRDRATTVRALAAWIPRNMRVGARSPVSDLTMLVSCNFFETYGLDHFERGRGFRPDECAPAGVPVAVISDEFWHRRLNTDPDVLDKPIVLNGQPFAVVGVTPSGFAGRLRGPGVWIPYTFEPLATRGPSMINNPDKAWLWVDGRLASGASIDAARSELNVLMRQQDSLAQGRMSAVAITNGAMIHDPVVRPIAMFVLPLILGSVGLVLLIAAGNVTLLLLSRAVARRREIAVRLAIGCSRSRLARMLLTESVLLAALGMPLSVWLAWQAPALMRRMFPMMPQYPLDPDVTVLSYLAAATLTAGVAAGLAPAVESLRQRLAPVLAGHDALAQGAGRSRLRDVLIAAQIGMSLVLLTGTVLFLRAERSIALRDPSVDAAHVIVGSYEPPRGATAAFMSAIAARMQEVPGVRSVAYGGSSGGDGPFGDAPEMIVRGHEAASARVVPLSGVSRSYFETLKRPMLQGRGFVDVDEHATIRPLVISDALARVWWPGASAIGAEIDARDGRRFEVVGVVHADALFTAGTADSIQAFALAPPQLPSGALFLRFEGDATAVKDAVRGVLREMTPTAPNVPTTLAEADEASASKFMPLVEMVGTLGLTAIVLALVGVYGVVSFAVGRRTREIGVRMALGATRADIAQLVLTSGAPPIAIGIAAGLLLLVPGVIALTRIFRFTPVPLHEGDPATYVLVVVILSTVAFATMLVPARRASAVPPSVALRTE